MKWPYRLINEIWTTFNISAPIQKELIARLKEFIHNNIDKIPIEEDRTRPSELPLELAQEFCELYAPFCFHSNTANFVWSKDSDDIEYGVAELLFRYNDSRIDSEMKNAVKMKKRGLMEPEKPNKKLRSSTSNPVHRDAGNSRKSALVEEDGLSPDDRDASEATAEAEETEESELGELDSGMDPQAAASPELSPAPVSSSQEAYERDQSLWSSTTIASTNLRTSATEGTYTSRSAKPKLEEAGAFGQESSTISSSPIPFKDLDRPASTGNSARHPDLNHSIHDRAVTTIEIDDNGSNDGGTREKERADMTFPIRFDARPVPLLGDQCAQVLNLTIAHLQHLKSEVRLLIMNDKNDDFDAKVCEEKISALLGGIEAKATEQRVEPRTNSRL